MDAGDNAERSGMDVDKVEAEVRVSRQDTQVICSQDDDKNEADEQKEKRADLVHDLAKGPDPCQAESIEEDQSQSQPVDEKRACEGEEGARGGKEMSRKQQVVTV